MCIYTSNAQNIELLTELYSNNNQAEISEEVLEEIYTFFEKPVNLNSITEDDCKKFFFLSSFEQQSLWYFIMKNKPLQSIYELQFVLGLPKEKALILEQLCIVEPVKKSISFSDKLQNGEHEFSITNSIPLISIDEYKTTTNYLGNPLKQCFRYRYNAYNSLFWGITAKKDAGEQFPFSSTQLFDFTSAYFQLKSDKKLSNVIVGNYKIQFGQGLTAWQGGFFNSYSDKINSKSVFTANKHSSSNEYDFLKGATATFSWNNIHISPFFSKRNIDGKINSDSSEYIFNLYETGYHRTLTELANKATVFHELYGINTSITMSRLQIGSIYTHQYFNKDSIIYTISNLGVSYIIVHNKTKYFGEIAINSHYTSACVFGINSNKIPDFEYTIACRYYNPNYTGTISNGFDDDNSPHNEIGFVSIWDVAISRFLKIQGTHDIFSTPYNSNYMFSTSYGNKQSLKIHCTPIQNFSILYNIAYSFSTIPDFDKQTYETIHQSKYFHKIVFTYPLSNSIHGTTGILHSSIMNDTTCKGNLLYQDISWEHNTHISFTIRYVQFNAPYDARLYVNEQNLTYMFTNSLYFKTGNQLYIIAKAKFTENLDIQCKYGIKHIFSSQENEFENRTQIIDFMIRWQITNSHKKSEITLH